MGYNASVLSVGTALYPSLGGALALLGWYVPFALPIVGLGVALAVLFRLDSVEVKQRAGLGAYLGAALAGMKNRKVMGLYLISILTFIVLYGAYMTFIPLHLASRFQSSAPAIGLIMSVGSLSTALTASRLRVLNRLLAPERLITLAFALYALSFLAIPWAPGHWFVAFPVALFGVAQGMNYPVVMSLLAGRASTEHRAIFMSVNGMVLRVGQTLGPLIMAGVAAVGGIDRSSTRPWASAEFFLTAVDPPGESPTLGAQISKGIGANDGPCMSPGTWLVLPDPIPKGLFLVPGGEEDQHIPGLDPGVALGDQGSLPCRRRTIRCLREGRSPGSAGNRDPPALP